MSHSQFEPFEPLKPYLDELERSATHLSAAQRAEWREEARQHLEQTAIAAEELGIDPKEAIEAAIRRFGDAKQLGAAMDESSLSGSMGSHGAILRLGMPLILAMTALIGIANAYVLTDSPVAYRWLQIAGFASFAAVPVLAGRFIGKHLARSRRKRSTVLAMLSVVGISLPIAGVLLVPFLGTSVEGAVVSYPAIAAWLLLTATSMAVSCQRNHLPSNSGDGTKNSVA